MHQFLLLDWPLRASAGVLHCAPQPDWSWMQSYLPCNSDNPGRHVVQFIRGELAAGHHEELGLAGSSHHVWAEPAEDGYRHAMREMVRHIL